MTVRNILFLVIAGSVTALCMVAAAAVLGMAPSSPVVDAFLCMALLLCGFLALALGAAADAPWRPFRLSMCWGGLVAITLIVAQGFTAPGIDLLSDAFWLLGAVGSFTATRLATAKPLIAARVSAGLAIAGLYIAIQMTRAFAAVPENWSAGPSVAYAAIIAASASAAWLAAGWHGRRLWTSGRVNVSVIICET